MRIPTKNLLSHHLVLYKKEGASLYYDTPSKDLTNHSRKDFGCKISLRKYFTCQGYFV